MPPKKFPAQRQRRQPGVESRMNPRPEYEPRFAGSGRLAGKVALITGGDSGIGRAIAVLFAREGARLSIIYREETSDAEETLELIRREGADGLLHQGDVADPAFCRRAVRATVAKLGRVDVLVNNAAEQHPQKDVRDITPRQLDRTVRTNIYGYFFMTQAALSAMRKGSAIVNTTSITAFRGSSHLVDYAATRGAVLAFTRSMASQLAAKGIRVNGVAPGPIWTPLIPASFSAQEVAKFGTDTPLGRAGQPNEVAPCFLFLACEDSSYMTGQTLHPNGGEMVGG